jgi:signal transduction histidine kinase
MVPADGEPILLPLDRELRERLRWFIRLRWVAGAAILVGGALGSPLLGIALPFFPLALVALTVLSYNLVFHLWRHKIAAEQSRLRRSIHLQMGLDWAALSVTVYLTGGIGSPISLSYFFHLIIGAILLSRRACYMLTAIASLLLGALALLTLLRPFPENLGTGLFARIPAEEPVLALYIWAGLTLFFLVTTYLATSITARLRQKEEALFRSERALENSYREMESMHRLGQLVNSTLDFSEVLSLIAENTTRLLDGKACFIRLFDKSGKKLYIGGSYGLSQAYINKGPVEVAKSLVDREALRGGIVQVPEVADDLRFQYREEARREGLRSMLSCPVQAKNRTLGVIRVYTAESRVFSEQEQSLLLNISNLSAVAIENARSFSELQALDKERVWFARTTHHQLRSPLAAVQGVIEALPFAGPLNNVQEDLVTRAKRRLQDAFDTIRDLLDLAAAQRLEGTAGRSSNLEESLRPVIETAREQARLKKLQFIEEKDGVNCLVAVEAADLQRIFSNLLNNAVKYTCSGQVLFGARQAGDDLEVWVEDTGMGISAEEQDRVFDAFYRSAGAKATGEMGTGLGLSIVRQIVDRVGGSLTMTSEPGKGTRFEVRLPLAE